MLPLLSDNIAGLFITFSIICTALIDLCKKKKKKRWKLAALQNKRPFGAWLLSLMDKLNCFDTAIIMIWLRVMVANHPHNAQLIFHHSPSFVPPYHPYCPFQLSFTQHLSLSPNDHHEETLLHHMFNKDTTQCSYTRLCSCFWQT